MEQEANNIPEKADEVFDKFEYVNFYRKKWIKRLLGRWVGTPDEMNVFILSGDAGCGKSTAIKELHSTLEKIGMDRLVCFSATTHVAADLLPGNATTCHSSFGFNYDMCTSGNMVDFVQKYQNFHGQVLGAWENCVRSVGCDFHWDGCSSRCPACVRNLRAKLSRATSKRVPEAALCSMIVVDEYGMLTELDFQKMIWVFNAFRINSDARTLVVSGSVSQLGHEGKKGLRAVHSSAFMKNIFEDADTTCFTVNCRQGVDTEYSQALSLMQYNLISKTAVDIFEERTVGEEKAMDPKFAEDRVRIFNCNIKKAKYIETYNAAKNPLIPLTLHVDGRGSMKLFYTALRKKYSKIFTDWRYPKWGVNLVGKIAPGSLIKTVSNTGQTLKTLAVIGIFDNVLHCKPPGSFAKEVTKVSAVRFAHDGITGTFYPVVPGAGVAINTFAAQGLTISGGLVYCPPAAYSMSPIKPSAYVAMSRVQSRAALWLSLNPFRTAGPFRFFPDGLLDWKYRFEMGYRS